MKAILRSINNFSCKLKQSNNLKYNISPKIRSNKFKNISGNGNIVIEDALNKNLKDYKIYGNTYQNSTNGKNLFDTSNLPNQSVLGISTSFNNSKIIFDGTSTQSGANYITSNTKILLSAGTYTFHFEEISGSFLNPNNRDMALFLGNSTNQTIYGNVNLKKTRPSITFTINESVEIWFYVYINGIITFNNWTIGFQLEEGSVATEFEPYTGGQPSPNPDYPQEIISCGDRTKNLIGFDDLTETTSNGVTYSIEDNVFTLNGTATDNIRYLMTDNWLLKNAGNHTLKIDVISGTWTAGIIGLSLRKANLTQETYHQLAYNTSNLTITKEYTEQNINNTVRIGFFINKNSVFSNFKFRIIFNEGSTATSYEPYGYKIPVNVRSENLFDINNNFERNNLQDAGITTVFNTDGTITVNGVKNNNYKYVYYRVTLPAGIYYFCGCPIGGSKNGYSSVVQITSDISSQIFDTGEGNTFILTEPTTIQFFPIRVGTSDVIFNNEVFKPMIAKIPVSYDDYQTYYNETTNIYLDEPLRKIDEYSDYIDFINGKVVRRIKETIYDGTENWEKYLLTFLIRNTPHTTTICYCNRFISTITTQWKSNDTSNRGKISTNNTIDQIKIMPTDENINTLELWKTWLSSNNTTVDYVLRTPTKEDIELPNINLIEGKNIITIGTEVYGVFEVEYYSKEIIDISNYKYNLRKVED